MVVEFLFFLMWEFVINGKINVGEWIINDLFIKFELVFWFNLGNIKLWEKVGVFKLEGIFSDFCFLVFKYL